MKKLKLLKQQPYTISNSEYLTLVEDPRSNSGESRTLWKGRPLKLYPKEGETTPDAHRGKNEYYFKPMYHNNDVYGVVLSRQLGHVFYDNKNIKICKQVLKKGRNFKYKDKEGREYLILSLVGSKATSNYISFDVDSFKRATAGNDFLKILGAEMIGGNFDWNIRNYGISNSKITRIDIEPCYDGKFFRGSYRSIKTFIEQIVKAANLHNSSNATDLMKILRIAYLQHLEESCEEFSMSATSIKEFVKRISEIAFSQQKSESLSGYDYDYLAKNNKDILKKQLIAFSSLLNQAVKEAKEDSVLFQQLCAYIDGATEFYHHAPNAEIKPKHILGGTPEIYIESLRDIQARSFEDFTALIQSFENQKLIEYFNKKNSQEQEKAAKYKREASANNLAAIEEVLEIDDIKIESLKTFENYLNLVIAGMQVKNSNQGIDRNNVKTQLLALKDDKELRNFINKNCCYEVEGITFEGLPISDDSKQLNEFFTQLQVAQAINQEKITEEQDKRKPLVNFEAEKGYENGLVVSGRENNCLIISTLYLYLNRNSGKDMTSFVEKFLEKGYLSEEKRQFLEEIKKIPTSQLIKDASKDPTLDNNLFSKLVKYIREDYLKINNNYQLGHERILELAILLGTEIELENPDNTKKGIVIIYRQDAQGNTGHYYFSKEELERQKKYKSKKVSFAKEVKIISNNPNYDCNTEEENEKSGAGKKMIVLTSFQENLVSGVSDIHGDESEHKDSVDSLEFSDQVLKAAKIPLSHIAQAGLLVKKDNPLKPTHILKNITVEDEAPELENEEDFAGQDNSDKVLISSCENNSENFAKTIEFGENNTKVYHEQESGQVSSQKDATNKYENRAGVEGGHATNKYENRAGGEGGHVTNEFENLAGVEGGHVTNEFENRAGVEGGHATNKYENRAGVEGGHATNKYENRAGGEGGQVNNFLDNVRGCFQAIGDAFSRCFNCSARQRTR